MPVRRVLAEADVRQQEQLGEAPAQLAQRALDDAGVRPRARALLVLVFRNPEQDHRLDAEADELLGLTHDVLDGEAAERRQKLIAARVRADEERHDELVQVEMCLSDQIAQRRSSAQSAETR